MLHAHAELAQRLGGTPRAGRRRQRRRRRFGGAARLLEGEHWARSRTGSRSGAGTAASTSGVAATRWRPSGKRASRKAARPRADADEPPPRRPRGRRRRRPPPDAGVPVGDDGRRRARARLQGGGAHTMGEQLRGASAGDASLALWYAQRAPSSRARGTPRWQRASPSRALRTPRGATARSSRSWRVRLPPPGGVAAQHAATSGDATGHARRVRSPRPSASPSSRRAASARGWRSAAARRARSSRSTPPSSAADAEAAASLGLAPGRWSASPSRSYAGRLARAVVGVALAEQPRRAARAQRDRPQRPRRLRQEGARRRDGRWGAGISAGGGVQQQQQALSSARGGCTPRTSRRSRTTSIGGDAHALAARRPADDVQERRDRTSMSVTLEHGRLLRDHHGLDDAEATHAVGVLRRHGVRRENVAATWARAATRSTTPSSGSSAGAAAARGGARRDGDAGHKMSCLRSKVMTPRRAAASRAVRRRRAAAVATCRRAKSAPGCTRGSLPVAEEAAGAATSPHAPPPWQQLRSTPTPPGRGLAPQRAQLVAREQAHVLAVVGVVGAVRFGATGIRGRARGECGSQISAARRDACDLQRISAPSASCASGAASPLRRQRSGRGRHKFANMASSP